MPRKACITGRAQLHQIGNARLQNSTCIGAGCKLHTMFSTIEICTGACQKTWQLNDGLRCMTCEHR